MEQALKKVLLEYVRAMLNKYVFNFQFSIMLLFEFMWLLIFARYLSLFVRPTGLVLLFEKIMLVAGIIFRDCEAY